MASLTTLAIPESASNFPFQTPLLYRAIPSIVWTRWVSTAFTSTEPPSSFAFTFVFLNRRQDYKSMPLALRSPYFSSLCNYCTIIPRTTTRRFRIRHGPLFNEATVSASQSPQETPKKSRVTRTKKAFAELPKTWLNPDGSPAEPLAPWAGGLEPLAPSQDSFSISTRVNKTVECEC